MLAALALSTLFILVGAAPSLCVDEVPGVTPWKPGADLRLARGGAASGWVSGRFVVAGGTYWQDGVKRWTDRVDALDPATDTWESLPSLPAPTADAGCAADAGALYVVGGAAEGRASARCLRLTHSAASGWAWSDLPALPLPRAYVTAVADKGRVWAFGGCDNPGDLKTASRQCFELNTVGSGGWRSIAPLPPPGRCLAAGTARGGVPFIFGGCLANEAGKAVNLVAVLRYERGPNRWRASADLPEPLRGATAVSLDRKHIGVFGGYSGRPDDIERYGPAYGFERRLLLFDGERFKEGAPLPRALMAPSVAANAGVVFLAGGEDRARSRSGAFDSAPVSNLVRHDKSRPVWVCLGDSVTHGVGRSGVQAEQTYPEALRRRLSGSIRAPWVLNGGVGGENTRQAISRLPLLLKPRRRVDLVVIMYGLNDAALSAGGPDGRPVPRVGTTEFGENLRALVREVRRHGAKPLLCTPNPMTNAYAYAGRGPYAASPDVNFALRDYVAICRQVATEEKVGLVDVFTLFEKRKGWEALFPDGIHPNAQGLELIAAAVGKAANKGR